MSLKKQLRELKSMNILIADPYKASLVMTSEVFKERLPGSSIAIAHSGASCLDHLEKKKDSFQMVVIDFDLPDCDGVSLGQTLKTFYPGPILMTAYPDTVVETAASKEFFPYDDLRDWIAKPLSAELLWSKIDRFLLKKQRTLRRIKTTIPGEICGKSLGRGKKIPKIQGIWSDLSLTGGCLKIPEKTPFSSDSVKVILDVQGEKIEAKGDVIWFSEEIGRIGVKFSPKEDYQVFFRNLQEKAS